MISKKNLIVKIIQEQNEIFILQIWLIKLPVNNF